MDERKTGAKDGARADDTRGYIWPFIVGVAAGVAGNAIYDLATSSGGEPASLWGQQMQYIKSTQQPD